MAAGEYVSVSSQAGRSRGQRHLATRSLVPSISVVDMLPESSRAHGAAWAKW
jgi:hypothetical protein